MESESSQYPADRGSAPAAVGQIAIEVRIARSPALPAHLATVWVGPWNEVDQDGPGEVAIEGARDRSAMIDDDIAAAGLVVVIRQACVGNLGGHLPLLMNDSISATLYPQFNDR